MDNHFAIIICVLCALLCSRQASSGVESDTVVLFGLWDFSEKCSKAYHEGGDVGIVTVVDPPPDRIIVACDTGALVAHLPDSTFEDLKYAPDDTTLYNFYQPYFVNSTYVVKTGDGKYAKIQFQQVIPAPIMEYVYQPDGTRKLFDPDSVGVQITSWGTIKCFVKDSH